MNETLLAFVEKCWEVTGAVVKLAQKIFLDHLLVIGTIRYTGRVVTKTHQILLEGTYVGGRGKWLMSK